MRMASYPGSFDPITNGHVKLVNRALKLFDKVFIIVADNIDKKYYFSLDERIEMVKEVFKGNDKIVVVKGEGLSALQTKALGCSAMIRGLRMISDYEYEVQFAAINEYLAPDIDMVFLMSRKEYSFISSSRIKEMYALKGDITTLVPPEVIDGFKRHEAHK